MSAYHFLYVLTVFYTFIKDKPNDERIVFKIFRENNSFIRFILFFTIYYTSLFFTFQKIFLSPYNTL